MHPPRGSPSLADHHRGIVESYVPRSYRSWTKELLHNAIALSISPEGFRTQRTEWFRTRRLASNRGTGHRTRQLLRDSQPVYHPRELPQIPPRSPLSCQVRNVTYSPVDADKVPVCASMVMVRPAPLLRDTTRADRVGRGSCS